MSLRATQWAWDVECPPTIKLVLLAIADAHHDKTGDAFPSHARIMKKTGLSESAVKRAIRWLDAAGRLTRIERACPRTRRTWGIVYNLAITQVKASKDASTDTSQGVTSGQQELPLEVAVTPGEGVCEAPPIRNRTREHENNRVPPGGATRPQTPKSPKASQKHGFPIPKDWSPKRMHLDRLRRDMLPYVMNRWPEDQCERVVRVNLDEWALTFHTHFLSLAHSRRHWRVDWDMAFVPWMYREFTKWVNSIPR